MPKKELTKRQREVTELFEVLRNKQHVANELGLSRSTVRNVLKQAIKKGYKPVSQDLQVRNSTVHVVYGPNGEKRIKQEWARMHPLHNVSDQLRRIIKDRTPISKFSVSKPTPKNGLMLEWILADLHHGMRAEAKETGQNYNLDISRKLVLDSAQDIFSRAEEVEVTKLVVLGDYFHSDFMNNRTEKSGFSLWTADTFRNIAECGVQTVIDAIEVCLLKSDVVYVDILQGNHDKQSSVWLEITLAAHFRKNPRVIVSDSQSKARFFSWGVNFFGYHHIDTGSPQALAIETLHQAIARSESPKFFYARTGHVHKGGKMVQRTEDVGKVVIERIPTLAAKDKFASDGLYNSARGTVANVFHNKKGLRYRVEVSPELLDDAYLNKGEEISNPVNPAS